MVFTIVGYPADVREVILGEGACSRASARAPSLVDMTTSEPVAGGRDRRGRRGEGGRRARRAGLGRRRGCPQREPCRSWSAATRRRSTRARPLFEPLGKTIVHQGDAGRGQHTKMVNQILIASDMIGVCEALALRPQGRARPRDGRSRRVSGGAAGSWSLSNSGRGMLARRLRARLLRRALPQGHGDRPRRGARMNLVLPGAGPGRTALCGRPQPGAGPEGHPVARGRHRAARAGRLAPALNYTTGRHLATDVRPQTRVHAQVRAGPLR